MISEKYKNMKDKLETLLNEHDLIYTFKTEKEPIILEVMQNSDSPEQLSMIKDDKGKSSKDAKVCFIFDGGTVTINTEGKLFMSEALMNKIKNIGKKLHYLYLHVYYTEHTSPELLNSAENSEDENEKETA